MKIVINDDYGGFGLSDEALQEYITKKGLPGNTHTYSNKIERDDPILVEIVERLKGKANSFLSSLKIVEIPDNIQWVIEEYYGREWIAESHQTWS